MAVIANKVYRIGDIEVDVSQSCVRRGDEELHLRHKTFQVLLYLLENRQRLITKNEFFDNLWKDTAVTDDALTKCITDIRKALGDDTRQPRLLKTVPKAGYRLIAPVEEFAPGEPTFVETEVTTFEVELREEDDNYRQLNGDQAESLRAAFRDGAYIQRLLPEAERRTYFGHRVILLGACLIAAILLSSIYLIHKALSAKHPLAEITLPQIPGKRPVVVMHFENQSGDREIDWLREGLADMLITDLSRSNHIAVLSRQQLHQLLENIGHNPDGKVQLDESLEVAQKSRAELIILGHFARLGQNIRIDVQLHDARTGNLLTTERLVVDKPGDVLSQMDLLSLRVATYLGAAPEKNAAQGLAAVMTNNLDAYRYYSLALEQAQRFQFPDAVKLLEKSLTLDPEFAMADARIGYIYAVRWHQYDRGKTYLEKAFQLSNRLTQKDQLYISAWYAHSKRDASGAIDTYRQLIAAYPNEAEAYQRLAWLLLLAKEKPEEALTVINQGLAVDPTAKDFYNQQGDAYTKLGRYAEAVAAFQRYVSIAPEDPNAFDSLGLCHQWFGHYDDAIAAYQRALTLNPESLVAIVHLANTYFQQGRYQASIEQYRRYIQVAWNDGDRARGYACITWVYMKKGDLDQAESAFKQHTKYAQGGYSLIDLMLALAKGDMTHASETVKKASDEPSLADNAISGQLRFNYYLMGSFALKGERYEEAIEDFRQAIKHRAFEWNIDSLENCLANAYLESGRLDEAIAEYERILKINSNFPLARYHLGQAFERKGQPDRARGEYQQFLQLWKDADQDIPEITEARKSITGSS